PKPCGHLQEDIMPCSLLLALGLLTAPECCTSLAQHASIQWSPKTFEILKVETLSPKTMKQTKAQETPATVPAIAEKRTPAKAVVVKTEKKNDNSVMPAIAERAPKTSKPQVTPAKIQLPAVAQKPVRVTAPVAQIVPMDLSPIAIQTSSPFTRAPAVAERLPQKSSPKTNGDEWQQVAQAWPTLPTNVRSEILRLIQTAE
ncbi:MAG: hypothetical protein KDA84_06730, partial [Planctomycetaceae bacterium]|nr:hypothetical protein [Planctomycetaceae bacterium]